MKRLRDQSDRIPGVLIALGIAGALGVICVLTGVSAWVLLLLLLGVLAITQVCHEILYRRSRERRGLCRRCGYDLRSAQHVCPECGFDHQWRQGQPVITADSWLTAIRCAAVGVLVLLMIPALCGAWLYWEQRGDRSTAPKLRALFTYRTANIAPVWMPAVIEPLFEPLLERVVSVKIMRGGTDGDLRILRDLTALRELDLSDSKVTDRGLGSLKASSGLEELTIVNASVTPHGIKLLTRALPGLIVHTDAGPPAIPTATARATTPPSPVLPVAATPAALPADMPAGDSPIAGEVPPVFWVDPTPRVTTSIPDIAAVVPMNPIAALDPKPFGVPDPASTRAGTINVALPDTSEGAENFVRESDLEKPEQPIGMSERQDLSLDDQLVDRVSRPVGLWEVPHLTVRRAWRPGFIQPPPGSAFPITMPQAFRPRIGAGIRNPGHMLPTGSPIRPNDTARSGPLNARVVPSRVDARVK